MYDYQSQTSLPPIRPRQQRPSGVQVQQLYDSSPVIATLSHKLQHGDSSTLVNGNSTTINNGTTNGYHHHQHNSISQFPAQQQTSDQSIRKSPSVDSMLSIRSSSQQKRLLNVLDPDTAMKTFMSKLTPYERHEIFSYPQIYFVGQTARKRQGVGGGPNNGKKK
jgi:dual specificity tyrosine-phosphorylation-regulated kinase 2/3/4